MPSEIVVAVARDAPLRLIIAYPNDPTSARARRAAFVEAVARRHEVVDLVDTSLHGWQVGAAAALTVHPSRDRWRAQMQHSRLAKRVRTRNLTRSVAQHRGAYDLLLRFGSDRPTGLPTVGYIDQTYRTAQQNWPGGPPWPSRMLSRNIALERRALHDMRHVFTMGAHVVDTLTNFYAVPRDRVTVVGAGCNFSPLPDVTFEVRPPRVLFVGYEFARKGGHDLLASFRAARSVVPEAELVVVGCSGSDEAGVTFRGIIRDRAQLAALYTSARVYCMPVYYEPFGQAFLEAMGHGLPCIGTPVGAIPEIIEHNRTGLLVPVGDRDALTRALVDLLSDGPRAAAMGAAGRTRLEQNFTWDVVVDRMTPVLERVADRPAIPRVSAYS